MVEIDLSLLSAIDILFIASSSSFSCFNFRLIKGSGVGAASYENKMIAD